MSTLLITLTGHPNVNRFYSLVTDGAALPIAQDGRAHPSRKIRPKRILYFLIKRKQNPDTLPATQLRVQTNLSKSLGPYKSYHRRPYTAFSWALDLLGFCFAVGSLRLPLTILTSSETRLPASS